MSVASEVFSFLKSRNFLVILVLLLLATGVLTISELRALAGQVVVPILNAIPGVDIA